MYSAAVCELSDACDMLLVRGFEDIAVDCDSAMFAMQRVINLSGRKYYLESRNNQRIVKTRDSAPN